MWLLLCRLSRNCRATGVNGFAVRASIEDCRRWSKTTVWRSTMPLYPTIRTWYISLWLSRVTKAQTGFCKSLVLVRVILQSSVRGNWTSFLGPWRHLASHERRFQCQQACRLLMVCSFWWGAGVTCEQFCWQKSRCEWLKSVGEEIQDWIVGVRWHLQPPPLWNAYFHLIWVCFII